VRREEGSASVVVIAILVALVVLAMGTADVGRVLVAAARAQSAADAAALAAAQELAFPGDLSPLDSARELAVLNGASLISCDCEPPALEATVEVEVSVGVLLFSGGDRVVTARARAVVEVPAD
jgi:secretion/DNA translocation related TadE-like protein